MAITSTEGAGAVLQATPAPFPPNEPRRNEGALTLAHFDQARHHLELAQTIDEVKDIRDQAEALRQYARQSRQSLEMQNRCAEIKLRAERKAGEMLAAAQRAPGTRTDLKPADTMSAGSPYRELVKALGNEEGTAERIAQRWQAVAEIPEETFEKHVRSVSLKGEELTTAGLMRAAASPHVSHNSGENEWYTPREYVEAARVALGAIDLDPASSARANEVVQAERFHSIEDDGLAQQWAGRVWMNPPYAADLIGRFTEKMAREFTDGAVDAAIVLVNNATETGWFQGLARVADAICFPARRIRFWNPEGEPGAPLQGQALIYLGTDPHSFRKAFSGFGLTVDVNDA